MILRIAIDVLIAVGLFFALAGTKGILKMPDTFCRMQASTCITTLGMLCTMIGKDSAHFLHPGDENHVAKENNHTDKGFIRYIHDSIDK